MKKDDCLVIEPLMVSQKSGQERGYRNEENDIIVGRRDGPDTGEEKSATQEIDPTDQNDEG